jgi:hypothetical protein
MLCLGMGGDPLPHASLRGNCAEINAAGDPVWLEEDRMAITIRRRLRTALLTTCKISGAAKQPSTRLMAMPTRNSINATRRAAPTIRT